MAVLHTCSFHIGSGVGVRLSQWSSVSSQFPTTLGALFGPPSAAALSLAMGEASSIYDYGLFGSVAVANGAEGEYIADDSDPNWGNYISYLETNSRTIGCHVLALTDRVALYGSSLLTGNIAATLARVKMTVSGVSIGWDPDYFQPQVIPGSTHMTLASQRHLGLFTYQADFSFSLES